MTPALRFIRALAHEVRDWTRRMTGRAASFLLVLGPLSLVLGGCANTTTSKYSFTDPSGRSGSIELPKDIQAEGLDIKTSSGARIRIAKLESTGNVQQTEAQGNREDKRIKAAADLAGKVSEGVTQGAVKALKGGLP